MSTADPSHSADAVGLILAHRRTLRRGAAVVGADEGQDLPKRIPALLAGPPDPGTARSGTRVFDKASPPKGHERAAEPTAGDTKPCYDALSRWKELSDRSIHGLSSRRGTPVPS